MAIAGLSPPGAFGEIGLPAMPQRGKNRACSSFAEDWICLPGHLEKHQQNFVGAALYFAIEARPFTTGTTVTLDGGVKQRL